MPDRLLIDRIFEHLGTTTINVGGVFAALAIIYFWVKPSKRPPCH